MSDIATRLRQCAADIRRTPVRLDTWIPLQQEAADTIDALRARVEQYQRALEVLYTDESGDLDYIKWYITEKVLTIEAHNAIDAAGLSGNKTAASNEVPK